MSYNTTKITVFNDEKEKDEDVKLFYSTITDNVGITCGEQEVFLLKTSLRLWRILCADAFIQEIFWTARRTSSTKKKVPIPSIPLATKRNGN